MKKGYIGVATNRALSVAHCAQKKKKKREKKKKKKKIVNSEIINQPVPYHSLFCCNTLGTV